MASTFCYIDPASTALIWQVLAGVFISLGVVFGVFWRKITTFFKSVWVKLFRKNKKQEEEKVVDESVLEIEDEVDTKSEVVESDETADEKLSEEKAEQKTEEVAQEQNNETENK